VLLASVPWVPDSLGPDLFSDVFADPEPENTVLKLFVRLLWRLLVLDPLLEDPDPEQDEATTRLTFVGLESSLELLPVRLRRQRGQVWVCDRKMQLKHLSCPQESIRQRL